VKKITFALVVALATCFAGQAFAKEHYREGSVKADTKEAFDEVAKSVREGMESGGRYEYVKPTEKTTIEKNLTEMDALFVAAGGTVAGMKEEQKIALFNAQETVNSILTLRDRDRVICKKEAPVGSHIPIVQCHTYGQAEDAKRGTEKQMADWKRAQCSGSGCAGN